MVNYKPSNQLSLSLFRHLFYQDLDKENRWVKLAEIIPCNELTSVYVFNKEINILKNKF